MFVSEVRARSFLQKKGDAPYFSKFRGVVKCSFSVQIFMVDICSIFDKNSQYIDDLVGRIVDCVENGSF